jgi:hypothetical protein
MRLFLASLSATLAVASVASAEPVSTDRKETLVVPYTEADDQIAAQRGGNPDISNILFVNRCTEGCTVTKSGVNNSVANTSAIPNGNDGQEFTIPAFQHSEATWTTLMQCLRDIFLPYDVVVTDVDPGNEPHHEAIASGLPADIGLPPTIGGIAPGGCEPRNNMLSYSFLNSYPASRVLEMCATVGQEASHSFGLRDHIFDCTDPMTYLDSCGQKFFRNKNMPCGEFEQAACVCSGNRQNSHVKLLSVFGEGDAEIPAPVIDIVNPANGATITNSTLFAATASDQRTVYRVELYLNDWLWGTYVESDMISPPWSPPGSYSISADGDFPDGNYDVRMVAYNDLGISTASSITAVKGSPCTSADSCLDGQQCSEGKCFWEQPSGDVGAPCEFDQQCIGPNTYDGQCASDGVDSMCTVPCFVGVNDNCPEGYACLEQGGQGAGVCWFETEEPEGCCETGGGASGGRLAFQLTMIGIVGLLVVRRRRASR